MSRGYSKSSFKAREASATFGNKMGLDPELEAKAVALLRESKAARDALRDVAANAEAYSNNSGEDLVAQAIMGGIKYQDALKMTPMALAKFSKAQFAKSIEALPEAIRDAIEVRKEEIQHLYRGVKDSKITQEPFWKNGEYVYSFTNNRNIATAFAVSGLTGGALLKAEDIESFKGIVDLKKLQHLVSGYNRIDGLKKSEKVYNVALKHAESEGEFLVYGIKFKGERDNPGTREKIYPWFD